MDFGQIWKDCGLIWTELGRFGQILAGSWMDLSRFDRIRTDLEGFSPDLDRFWTDLDLARFPTDLDRFWMDFVGFGTDLGWIRTGVRSKSIQNPSKNLKTKM